MVEGGLWGFEFVCDMIMLVDVFFNFLKADRVRKDLYSIGEDYVTGYFIFDILACVPAFFMLGDPVHAYSVYWMHLFRLVHL